MNDEELLAAVLDTRPALEQWRKAFNNIITPGPGSDLAADDEEWPYLPTTSLVSAGLATAREHLHAVQLLIDTGEMFPAVVSTLCRSALIGASQAVWILEPDERNERLRRSLSLAAEDYIRNIQCGRDTKKFAPDNVAPHADQQLETLELRRLQVHTLLEPLGGPVVINLTDDIIPTALGVAVPSAAQRGPMVLRWRSMSAAAHALTWHYFGNEGTTATDLDEGGVGRIETAGDTKRLVMDFFPPYHVAAAGWRLLEQRRTRIEPRG